MNLCLRAKLMLITELVLVILNNETQELTFHNGRWSVNKINVLSVQKGKGWLKAQKTKP